MPDQKTTLELKRLRNLSVIKNWKRGDPYPTIKLPSGYGFTTSLLTGGLLILPKRAIGKPHLDPNYSSFWNT